MMNPNSAQPFDLESTISILTEKMIDLLTVILVEPSVDQHRPINCTTTKAYECVEYIRTEYPFLQLKSECAFYLKTSSDDHLQIVIAPRFKRSPHGLAILCNDIQILSGMINLLDQDDLTVQ